MVKERYREAAGAYERTAKMLPNYHPELSGYVGRARCLADRQAARSAAAAAVCGATAEGGGGGSCTSDHDAAASRSVMSKYISCSGENGKCGINLTEGDEVIARWVTLEFGAAAANRNTIEEKIPSVCFLRLSESAPAGPLG